MNKREQQRLERREQILHCALDLMISKGYEAMQIRDIAKRLNISTGLFFNYFESKEKIYEELIKIGVQGPRNVLELNVEGIDPIELFEKMTHAIFESMKSYPMTAKMFVLMARTLSSQSVPESVRKLIDGFDMISPILPVIRKGQQLGEIRAGEPVLLASAYWGAIQGIGEAAAAHPDLSLPESNWPVDILRKQPQER
jgi:AcrR family transcriptional regulator